MLSFKEYLIEDETFRKYKKKFHLDKNRAGKLVPKERRLSVDDEFGDPEGMKTAGGPTFSG